MVRRASRPPRPCRGVLRVVSGGCVREESCPARSKREASGCCLRRSVGSVWPRCVWGARPAPPPSGEACVGGLPGRQGGRLGGETNPRARAPVWQWGLRSMSFPSSPRGPASLRWGCSPPRSSLAGLKSPVDLLPSTSGSRATTRPRVHGGSVLFLRFSPGVGRRPVSRRSPSAWSLSRPLTVLRLRPEGSGGSPFPRRCASLCCVLGVARCGPACP